MYRRLIIPTSNIHTIFETTPKMNMDEQVETNDSNQGQSRNQVSVHISIIGDAFADIFCFLSPPPPKSNSLSSSSSSPSKTNDVVVPMGGCVLINQPLQTMAGGSGINTCTQLRFLLNHFAITDVCHNDDDDGWNLELQTVLNPNDEHGQMLINHAKKHNFDLITCPYSPPTKTSSETDDENENNSKIATPHVIVLVSPGERSFIAHLGCVEHFHAQNIQIDRLVHPSSTVPTKAHSDLQQHHLHMHIAGYYNIPGFWNNQLKDQLLHIISERQKRQYTTTISLTPQYDSLQEWDGQILSLLECIDFLILSEEEAIEISKINYQSKNESEKWNQMAKCYRSHSSKTFVIVTLGAKGAIALYEGRVIHTQPAHEIDITNVVDATGAGDAFAGGFVFGFLIYTSSCDSSSFEKIDNIQAVKRGMAWGCTMGAACVQIAGASVPPTKEGVLSLLSEETCKN